LEEGFVTVPRRICGLREEAKPTKRLAEIHQTV
jgi:hypothetical protein